ncbi:MAG: sodium:solute symporter family protein [Elusimicrobia bacterium]|nr:sodium:solute symporter family protein [Elusimicrobiota bacterium]
MKFELSRLDYGIILLYFVANMVVGFSAIRRKKSGGMADFLLGGRQLTLPIFVATLVSTWYGGVLGVGEYSYRYGILNWVVLGLPYYVFALLYAWFLAPRIVSSGVLTLPDLLGKFYDRKASGVGAILLLLLVSPAPYLLMLWVLLKPIIGIPMWLSMFLVIVCSVAYLFQGGFRSDVRTDVLDFILMYSGLAVLPVAAYFQWGGFGFLKENLPALHLSWDGGQTWGYIGSWWFLALWTLVEPTFYQRCLAAKDIRVARWGIVCSIPFWFLFDAITMVAGLYARAALPDLSDPILSYPALADKILPSVWKGFFYVGMLATIFSSLNSLAFLSASTLGRDLVWRFMPIRGLSEEGHVKWGLFVSIVAGTLIALWLPSVVDIWYTLATVAVAGLLFPLCMGYSQKWKPRPQDSFWIMLGGSGTSLVWMFLPYKPLGLEPIYPGLMVALFAYGYSLVRSRGLA